MNLGKKLKIALDESRMIVLGAQILIGFQFRVTFQNLFDQLPDVSRYLNGVAVLLMIFSLALLILPGPYHRIVEQGNASGRFLALTHRVAAFALIPFVVSIGIDIGIAGERVIGAAGAVIIGVSTAALAAFFWFGMGILHAQSRGHKERAMTESQIETHEDESLHEKISQMLTEARVILPGAQALLGFQLAIVATEAFEKLPPVTKMIHGAALIAVAVSTVLLIAPAAFHRLTYGGEDSEDFYGIGSLLVTAATIPLALGLSADVYVVSTRIVPSEIAASLFALIVLAVLIGLWHALPLIAYRQKQVAQASRHSGC